MTARSRTEAKPVGAVPVRSKIGKWILFNLTGYRQGGSDPRQDLMESWTDSSLDQFIVLRYTFVILSNQRFRSHEEAEISSFARAVWSLMSLKAGVAAADIEQVIRNAISQKAGALPPISEGAFVNIYSACSKAIVVDNGLSADDVTKIVSRAEASALSQNAYLYM